MLLLNPGPVTLTPRVRHSLTQPDLCHRESEFYDLQDEARTRLLAVYGLDPRLWVPVLMTASGTGAVEAMLAALVPREGPRARHRERRIRRAHVADVHAIQDPQ